VACRERCGAGGRHKSTADDVGVLEESPVSLLTVVLRLRCVDDSLLLMEIPALNRAKVQKVVHGRFNPAPRWVLSRGRCNPVPHSDRDGVIVIVLGLVLLLLGYFLGISILWTIGIILLVVGAVLYLLGSVGRPVSGRRHYW
jgi:hypothetical protein